MALAEQARNFFGPIEHEIGFSQVVRVDRTLYLSGLIAVNEELAVVGPGDMGAQLSSIYATMEKILSAEGGSLRNLVKETVFVTDLDALKQAFPIRRQIFERAGAHPPASTMIGISELFFPEAMAEIEGVAVL